MDTFRDNGTEYLKANTLAKKYRYTTDYIGQLCRQGKVDARLVGRAWFVSEQSLLGHKSDKKKEFRPNEIHIKINAETPVATVVQPTSVHSVVSKKTHRQFFSDSPESGNSHWQNRSHSYAGDFATLVPQMTPKIKQQDSSPTMESAVTSIPVELASSEKVVVRDTTKHVAKALEFTPLPEVSLHGELTVENLDTESDYEAAEPVHELEMVSSHEIEELPQKGVVLRYQTGRPAPVRVRTLVNAAAVPAEITVEAENVVVKEIQSVSTARQRSQEHIQTPVTSVRRRLVVPFIFIAALIVGSFLAVLSTTTSVAGGVVKESITVDEFLLGQMRALLLSQIP